MTQPEEHQRFHPGDDLVVVEAPTGEQRTVPMEPRYPVRERREPDQLLPVVSH